MMMIMRCECGEVTHAETEEELIDAVERHVAEHHPDLLRTLTSDAILAMAEMA